MTDQQQEDQLSTFRLFDGGATFGGRHWWYNGHDKDLMSCVSVWSWEDVKAVGTVPEGILIDMPEPKCVLYWLDQYIYLQAHPLEVQRAWRTYRKAKEGRGFFFSLRFSF